MSQANKFYITTSIPYVNAYPHLGHALEYVQTDVLARLHRQQGEDVFFLTGADENSLKNVRAAEAEGVPTLDLVNRNAQRFFDLLSALEISNDDFIRTVSARHIAGCQKLWSACRPEDIYKKSYKGLYCVGCEAFYNEDELVDGNCPQHLRPVEVVEEENYFFKLSNYQEKLEELIASDRYRVVPEGRRNEILSFIRMGLRDFSISRSQARARNWGVPVPGDESQVMYVWFDALGNYITGLDYGNMAAPEGERKFERYWPADVHVVGKDIIRFHAVYWPAMLMSAGLPLPASLYVHGFINLGGAKMSKSLGTVVDPFELVQKYSVEPVRYYLMRHIHPYQDSDFTNEALETAFNADLANGIGNLLSRSLTLIEKNMGGVLKKVDLADELDRSVVTKFEETFAEYERLMGNYDFAQALGKVWEAQAALDRYINDKKPWSLAKDPANAEELARVFYILTEGQRMLASLIYPVMPKTAEEMWRRLGMEQSILDVAWEDQKRWGLLPDGVRVNKGESLFPRLV